MVTKRKEDLYGSAPDKSKTALLIIDMIQDFSFQDGEQLFKQALPISENINKLKATAEARAIPIIYVNDNFDKWKSNFHILLNHALESEKGNLIAHSLKPDEKDYFVLKPKHSGFFSSSLDILLQYLEVENLILSGLTTDICILFTANDGYMRDFNIIVPSNCCTAVYKNDHENALMLMQRVLKAETKPWEELDFDELI